MQITLRSQMIAGATAVIGASAIAITPVAPAVNLPSLSTAKAEVALSAFANPITAALATGFVAGSYLLNGDYSLISPSSNWPASGTPTYPAGIGLLLNGALKTNALGGYASVGLLPQIIADSAPIATQLIVNGLGYIWNTVKAVGQAGADIGDILWSIPTTAVAVVTDLLALNFAGAISEITTAVTNAIGLVSDAGQTLLDAGIYVATGVITRASAVVNYLTTELPTLVGATVGQITQLVNKVVAVGTAIVGSLATLNPETIWNTVVGGLLAPTGIPGTVLNLTLGAGLQTGAIAGPGDIATNFIPSVRSEVQIAVKGIADALGTANPAPPTFIVGSAASVRAAAAVKAAPAVSADAAAPEAAATGDNGGGDATATAAADTSASTAAADESAPANSKASAGKAGRR